MSGPDETAPGTRSPSTALAAAALLVFLGAGFWVVTELLALPWVVAGPSMLPTLADGDRVLVDVWSYRHRSPRPGEVVLLVSPRPGQEHLVKRVDQVSHGDGPGRIRVLGDNPDTSSDSRSFGTVPRSQIRGRVLVRYWPPSRAGIVR